MEKLFINKQQALDQQVQFYTAREHAEGRHMLRTNQLAISARQETFLRKLLA